jgi:hypothetical protein
MSSSELSIPEDMSATLQRVQDAAKTPSAFLISTNAVQISPPAGAPQGPTVLVEAAAATGTAPSLVLHSRSSESAIRFTASGSDKAFHLGIGGNAGAGTFFIFSTDAGVMFRVEQDGDVILDKNVTIGGQLNVASIDANQTKLLNVPPATTVLKHLMIDPASGKLFMH